MNQIIVKVNNTPEVLAKLKNGIKSALEESGNMVENGAALRCPHPAPAALPACHPAEVP